MRFMIVICSKTVEKRARAGAFFIPILKNTDLAFHRECEAENATPCLLGTSKQTMSSIFIFCVVWVTRVIILVPKRQHSGQNE